MDSSVAGASRQQLEGRGVSGTGKGCAAGRGAGQGATAAGGVGGWGVRGREGAVGKKRVPQGRWAKRVQEKDPLEVLGHRAGSTFLERLSSPPPRQHGSADLAQSREEEDGVVLGGSGEDDDDDDDDDDDEQGYSLDFEEPADNDGGSGEGVPGNAGVANRDTEPKDSGHATGCITASASSLPPPPKTTDADVSRTAFSAAAGVASEEGEVGSVPAEEVHDDGISEISAGSANDKSLGSGRGKAEIGLGDAGVLPLGARQHEQRDKPKFSRNETGDRRQDSGVSDTVEKEGREDVVRATVGGVVGRSEGWGDKGRVDGVPSVAAASGSVGADSSRSNNRDDAGKRGRRIIETEGAVENMRRRLSAMGFLEPGGDNDADGSGRKFRSPDSVSACSPSGLSSKSTGKVSPPTIADAKLGTFGESSRASAVDTAAVADSGTESAEEGTNLDALISKPGEIYTAGESGAETDATPDVSANQGVERFGALVRGQGQGRYEAPATPSSAVHLRGKAEERTQEEDVRKGKAHVDYDLKEAKVRGGHRRVTLDTATPSPPSYLRDDNDVAGGGVAGVLDHRLRGGNEEGEGGRAAGVPPYVIADDGNSSLPASKTRDARNEEGRNGGVGDITDYSSGVDRACNLMVDTEMAGAACCSSSSLGSDSAVQGAPRSQLTMATPPRAAAAAVLSTGEILPTAVDCSGEGGVLGVGGEIARSDVFTSGIAGKVSDRQRRSSSWRKPGGGHGVEGDMGLAVLPRPDEEYELALLNLTAAAARAAELYRELTEASSGSLSVAHEMVRTATSESAGDESSFNLTPPRERDGGGRVGVSLVQRDRRRKGEGAPEWEERDGEDKRGDEWVESKTGSLVWEKSFRESFASVNDVLSVIADRDPPPEAGTRTASGSGDGGGRGRPPLRQHTEDDSSSWAARPFSPSSRRRVTAWGTPSSSQAGVTPSTTYASARGGQSGPGVASPEGAPSRRRSQEAAGSSGGGSALTSSASSRGTAAGDTGWSGRGGASVERAATGVGGGGFVESGEEVPAEVSGMLQRYSEMMLRIMQEKMEARIADGTLYPGK